MLEGKKIEVIIISDLEEQALKEKLTREVLLEKILNEYADAGYSVAGVWKDVIIMEDFTETEEEEEE